MFFLPTVIHLNDSKVFGDPKHLITTRIIFHIILVTMLAFNLASHSNEIWPNDGWYGRCLYWFVRLMLESVLFLGSFYLIWQLFQRQMPLLCLCLGFLLSWFVFVLAITMIDISLGREELGGIDLNDQRLVSSGMFEESLWILPKHVFFCLLITLINFRIDYSKWFKLSITVFYACPDGSKALIKISRCFS